jgi:hypothetical protein
MRETGTLLSVVVLLAGAGPAGASELAGPPAPASQVAAAKGASGSTASLPTYLHDRGTGVPTSMFGTYIRRGELIVYPFFEYYKDDDFEYNPEELGYAGTEDFRGKYRASEGLLFLGYGLTDDLAIEMEAAVIEASFEKSPADPSAMPGRIEESGLGDVEGQLRWRWHRESERSPELFSYLEAVIPHAEEKLLIGTAGWEFKLGAGLVRGFRWGTLSLRAAVDYEEASSSHFDLGEYAVEYLRRVSPRWRIYLGLEGTQDELSLITEVQWHLGRNAFIRFNNGLGLTSKATDWSPEVGILFTLPTRRSPPADPR